MLTRKEVRKLKLRHAQLIKWKRQAQAYSEKYGGGGSLETRRKHEMQLSEAEHELPVIEEKLRNAWKEDANDSQPARAAQD